MPEEIDVKFIQDFKNLIISQVEQGKKFVIDTGGGRTCRKYQQAAKDTAQPSNEDLDWIGIATNNLNAELIRVVFGEHAHHKVIYNLAEKFSFDKPIVIGGAYEPGHSSDFDATLAAKSVGAKKIINLSNIDYAYDKDPKKYPDAKRLENISWKEYRSLIPDKWISGLHTPFDPIASKMAEEEGLEVAILNGKNISNIENYLNGKNFIGTRIK